jgi:hypothetical protein
VPLDEVLNAGRHVTELQITTSAHLGGDIGGNIQ